MELAGEDGAPLERRHKTATVVGAGCTPAWRCRSQSVRVREIGVARPEKPAARLGLNQIPAQLWYADRGGKAGHPGWHDAEAGHAGVLLAFLAKELKPEADRQRRMPCADALDERRGRAVAFKLPHRGSERTHPG